MNPMILFLEDEVLISDIMEHALEDAGFSFAHAVSGEAAVKLMAERHDRFIAMVTDIGLAGDINGWDLARYARELNADMPIVYTTGARAAEWAVHGVPKSILCGALRFCSGGDGDFVAAERRFSFDLALHL